jgi:glucose-1-phosphate thymidylyltransferase
MKGIILAGGSGTRLYPTTLSISKHLLPVYNKPMIYYSLSTLILAKIKDILIITNEQSLLLYKSLFKDSKKLGLNISFAIQDKPKGLADAFRVGKKFIGKDSVCLILGDNFFYGDGFSSLLKQAITVTVNNNACFFTYPVKNPNQYGVLEIKKNIQKIVEKPKKTQSKDAVVGLYFYPNDVVSHSQNILPSKRGELEITDINNIYLKKKRSKIIKLGRGFSWFDAGTYNDLLELSNLVKSLENRLDLGIGYLEEICFKNSWVSLNNLKKTLKKYENSDYARYLEKIK